MDAPAIPGTVAPMAMHPYEDSDSEEDPFETWDDEAGQEGNGLLRQDPENPDPGCVHPWYRLGFLEADQGFACEECLRTWPLDDPEYLPDALLSVWQSAKTEFSGLQDRYTKLVAELESITSRRSCRVCGDWLAPETMSESAGFPTCPSHLGAALARTDYGAPVDDVALQLMEWANTGTIEGVWQCERNIAAYPPLAEATGSTMQVLRDQEVTLAEGLGALLNVTAQTTIGSATDALAQALELDHPRSRAGIAYLIGILAGCSGADEESLDGEHLCFPEHPTDRAVIVLDLCRSDLPETVEFSGDMADDIVRSIAERAHDLFSEPPIH